MYSIIQYIHRKVHIYEFFKKMSFLLLLHENEDMVPLNGKEGKRERVRE